MNLKLIAKILFSLSLLVMAAAAYLYLSPNDAGDKPVSIIIESGESFQKVGNRLVDAGLVRSRMVLFAAARWRGIDRKLTPGRYDFRGGISCRAVLDKLEKAEFVNIKVTIYEGAPIWAVASILARLMEVDSTEVIRLNDDMIFLQSLQLTTLEGYLFPETYFFPWGAKPAKMLSEMVAMYHQKTDKVWVETIAGGLSRQEIIVLASIVEAEAQLGAEKSTIASVYHNRLRRKMKLDADPTVIYGLGGLERPLNRHDLRKDSPYNTYMRKGLPPTAINSPGLAAIIAALHPAETDFLYFVADGSGGHRFARSNYEHNRNRREIRRESAKN